MRGAYRKRASIILNELRNLDTPTLARWHYSLKSNYPEPRECGSSGLLRRVDPH